MPQLLLKRFQIKLTCIAFGLRLLLPVFFWNHFKAVLVSELIFQ